MLPLKPLHRQRLKKVGLYVLLVSSALFLFLDVTRHSINLYITPSELLENSSLLSEKNFRLGGQVKPGSIEREGLEVSFTLIS